MEANARNMMFAIQQLLKMEKAMILYVKDSLIQLAPLKLQSMIATKTSMEVTNVQNGSKIKILQGLGVKIRKNAIKKSKMAVILMILYVKGILVLYAKWIMKLLVIMKMIQCVPIGSTPQFLNLLDINAKILILVIIIILNLIIRHR